MEYVNIDKLNRAKKFAKDQGKDGDKKVIHDRYVELGGLVRGEEESNASEAQGVTARMSREKLEDAARNAGMTDEDIAALEEKGELVDAINKKLGVE